MKSIAFAVTAAMFLSVGTTQAQTGKLFEVWDDDIPAQMKVRAAPEGWTEKQHEQTPVVSAAPEEDRQTGFSVFAHHFEEQVYPYTRFPDASLANEVRFFAARNEYEVAAFSVRTYRRLPQFTVRVTELRDAAGNVFPKNRLDIRRVEMIYHADADEKTYSRSPGILVKRDKEDLDADTAYTYLVHAWIPEETPAGIYEGALAFGSTGSELRRVRFRIRVLPITLQRSEVAYAYWYGPRWLPLDRVAKQLDEMNETGMDSVVLCNLYPTPNRRDDRLELDFTQIDSFVELMKERGMTGPLLIDGRPINGAASLYGYEKAGRAPPGTNPYEIPVCESDATRSAFLDMMRQLKEHAEANDWPETFVYAQEESSNKAVRMKALMYFTPLIKQVFGRSVLVSNAPDGGGDEARGNDFFTHRSYSRVNPKLLEDVRAKGDTLWLFNYCPLQRAMWALALAKVDAQAYSAWAYRWEPAKNPYDPFAGGNAGWFYSYPADTGPLPAIRAVSAREAIDTYRYIQAFRAAAAKAKAQGGRPQEVAQDGERFLQRVLDDIPLDLRDTEGASYLRRLPPEYPTNVRWKLALTMLKLAEEEGGAQ